MGKRLLWTFLLLVAALTTAALLYLQSESFARLAKEKIQTRVTRSLGLELNFDRLQIGILPPSLSLLNVDVKVLPSNSLGLATDTVFRSERMGFSFRMIQAFSRGIMINKVFVNEAELILAIPQKKGSGKEEKISELVHQPIRVELGEDFFLSIRQLELRNTKLQISWREGGQLSAVDVNKIIYLAVTPSAEGTSIVANLEHLKLKTPKISEEFRVLKANAEIDKDLITLSTLDLQRREAALHAAGKLVGSIDDLENARPDLDLILRGPLSELTDFEKSLAPFQGEILADLKVVGRLKDPSVQARMEVDNFKYASWQVNKIEVSGTYGSGLMVLDSLSAKAEGGQILLRNKIELPIPFVPGSKAFQLKFTNVGLENFAGDLKKSINNLKMHIDGIVRARVDIVAAKDGLKLGSLSFQPELTIKNLELNNQVYGKTRPYKTIFRVEPFKLLSDLEWKQGALRIGESTLELGTGKMNVSGQVTKAGFDISGYSEKVDMGKEVGAIAGIPLTGEGAIGIEVKGPSEKVRIDFDLNQRNAKFLDFDFGLLEGRVTYDDGDSYLYLEGLKGKKNSAEYQVHGKVNLGEGDDLLLQAKFKESDPNDLFAIFAKSLKDLTWIPHGMTGLISGEARVGGGYDGGLATLDILSQVKGRNLSYRDEMLHEVEATAGLRKGVVFGRTTSARKYDSVFSGNVTYDLASEKLKYELSSERGKLRSLDFVSHSGFPIDGLFSLHSAGEGKWETLESTTRIDVQNGFVRTLPLPPATFVYKTHPDFGEYKLDLGEAAQASGRLAYQSKGESRSEVSVSGAHFGFLLCMVSRRNCTDPVLAMNVRAQVQVNWKGADWTHMQGAGQLQELAITKSGYSLKMPAAVGIRVANGLAEAERFQLVGEATNLEFRLKGRVDGSAIDNRMEGPASMRLLEFLTPLVEEARGKMQFDLGLAGDLSNAKFHGNVLLEDAFLRFGGLDAPIDNLRGRLRFADSRISLESMVGQLGGGGIQATGSLDFYLNRAPRFDIDLFFSNNRVKFFPVNYADVADGKLSFTGDKPPYLFGGTVKMKKVVMRNNFDVGGNQKGLQNARYLPEKISGSKSFYEVKIRAVAERGVMVENNLLDAEFQGEATLLNNFEFPQIVARAELVRGKLLFRNTAFTLDHALIRQPNPEFFNPQFSIGGVANVDNYRISIFASGTTDKPKITLSSYPAMPQEEIVSLLAFGYRTEDTKRISQNDTSAITYSEVGSILIEQMQLNQNLQSKGLRVHVAPVVSDNEANIIQPNSSTPGAVAPKVYVQTQLLKNLDAFFGGTVGSTQGQSMDARLEYRLGNKASVSAVYEQAPGLDPTEVRNSYGADLKFRWGFK